MTGKFRKALSLSVTALFIVFSAVMLAFVLPTGWKALSVQTGSMEPSISPGDLVLVRNIPAANYQTGDVITFVNPENKQQTITHRIVGINEGSRRVYVTKGDANDQPDRPFNETQVVGKTIFTVPFLGRLVDFMHTIPGLILVIYIPAIWMISIETKRLTAYYRRIKPYSLYGNKRPHGSYMPAIMFASTLVLAITLTVSVPVYAAMKTRVTLTGNTITLKSVKEDNNVVTCKNKTNVNINSTTNQSAYSDNVSINGNTSTGSATSGNASNTSSTSIGINVTNGSCKPT